MQAHGRMLFARKTDDELCKASFPQPGAYFVYLFWVQSIPPAR